MYFINTLIYSPEAVKILEGALPQRPPLEVDMDNVEEVALQDIDTNKNSKGQRRKEVYAEDEYDDDEEGHTLECSQQ